MGDRIRPFADRLWIAEAPLRFYGVPFGTRMTVAQLADGSLWIHSPIALDEELRERIDALGAPGHVVSPNKLHHLYLASFSATYPDATVWLPPGLAAKRPELRCDGVLGDVPPDAFAQDFAQLVIRGSRVMDEVVFLHRATRTLIVADVCEYFGPDDPWLTRLVARLGRMYDRPRMPADWQLSFRDRDATRRSFEALLSWDFDRVILAHGRLIESGAHALFERAYAWALR